ncbi:hypothetical protein QFW77_03595 [Luteimonas sp. RD2P54]|uniref:Uncharacterized protein n=1 Tax=Luteimonas endophytica TaxID=3042023 RepID=A0ABT6J5H2_9GAMM|nr:hypothetical protein [Luteimonas endophytica]MDH5822078.1 hypothetical protein [Luteimonas endophytica]
MTDIPVVQINQWIRVGHSPAVDGLVLETYSDGSLGVGYYQNHSKAIKDDVIWDGSHWQFKHSGPSGSYLHGAEEAMVKRGPLPASGT